MLLCVLKIDLFFDKDVKEIWVDVSFGLHGGQSQYLARLRQRVGSSVGPVAGCERFEDIGDGHDVRLHRHLILGESLRVASAIHPFMAATRKFRHPFQMLGERKRVQQVDRGYGMVIDKLAFFWGQCALGDGQQDETTQV